MINYAGPSMNPTLIDGDRLNVIPYNGDRIRVGDVIVFQHPDKNLLMVHRVVSTSSRIITRGDNNRCPDRFSLTPEHITGKVVSALRGKKHIKIYGGKTGWFLALILHTRIYLDKKVSALLHPLYHWLAETGLIRRIFKPWINIRKVSFQRGKETEHQLLMGKTIIARLPAGANQWIIKRPFKVFIDKSSLQTTKSKEACD